MKYSTSISFLADVEDIGIGSFRIFFFKIDFCITLFNEIFIDIQYQILIFVTTVNRILRP